MDRFPLRNTVPGMPPGPPPVQRHFSPAGTLPPGLSACFPPGGLPIPFNNPMRNAQRPQFPPFPPPRLAGNHASGAARTTNRPPRFLEQPTVPQLPVAPLPGFPPGFPPHIPHAPASIVSANRRVSGMRNVSDPQLGVLMPGPLAVRSLSPLANPHRESISLPVTPVQTTGAVAPVEDDQAWAERWLHTLQTRCAKQEDDKPADEEIRISDAVHLIKSFETQSKCVLEKLAKLQGTVTYELPDVWEALCKEAAEACDQLASSVDRFSAGTSTFSKVTRAVKRRRLKRSKAHQKRRLHWEQESGPTAIKRRDDLHRRIGEWQARRIASDISQRQERSLRNQAGGAHGEVRKKQTDVARSQELLGILSALHTKRTVVLHREGVDISAEAEENFQQKVEALQVMWNRQSTVYDQEEKLLKVMLMEEKEEEVQRQIAKAKQTAELRRDEERRAEEELDTEESRYEPPEMPVFRLFYEQASSSMEQFLSVRRQWDLHSVPVGTFGSSTVPADWPSPPSAPALLWADFSQTS